MIDKSHTSGYDARMMASSDIVRGAIQRTGMTLYGIAKASGVTPGALTRFMAGERDMNLRTLDKIAPTIGVRLVVEKPRKRQKGR